MTTHELLLQKQYFMTTHEKVIQDLQTRQLLGVQKYGVTVDDAKLTETEWLRHAYEEALDMAVYLRRLLNEKECYHAEQSEIEKRNAMQKWTDKGLPF